MELPSTATARDAARLAIQSACAAAAVYLVMRWLGLPEVFVGVLSAVLIVQPSVGHTLGSGMQRVVATLVGCGVGVVTILLIPYGYGTAVSLAISMLVMNGIAYFRSEWRYGVVAAVALALGAEQDLMTAALDRSLSIGLGATVGMVASLVVWPEKASTRATRKLRRAVDVLCEAIEWLVDEDVDSSTHSKWQSDYRGELGDIDTLIENVRLADDDSLVRRRDAIEDLAQAVEVFGRCAQSERINKDAGGDESGAGKVARELSEDLAKGVREANEDGTPMDRAIREVAERFGEAIERWQDECGCQEPSSEDAMAFALLELRASVNRLAKSYAQDSESDDADDEAGG